jgi:hypothetical protein
VIWFSCLKGKTMCLTESIEFTSSPIQDLEIVAKLLPLFIFSMNQVSNFAFLHFPTTK